MRALTLDEKITLKGLIAGHKAFHGSLPMLTMPDALFYWSILYGKSISVYYKYL